MPRPFAVIDVPSLAGWPEQVPFQGQRFSLLLVLDETDLRAEGSEGWSRFEDLVISQGIAYFSAWGPQCEVAHDLMDEILIANEVIRKQPKPFFMTSWHEDESLEDALFFLRHCAICLEHQDVDNAPGLVAVIDAPELAQQARRYLGCA